MISRSAQIDWLEEQQVMATAFMSERAGRGPGWKEGLAATSEGGKLRDARKCGPQSQEPYLSIGCHVS